MILIQNSTTLFERITQLITDSYALDVTELRLLDSHFGTEIYVAHSKQGKFVVKSLPLEYHADLARESEITDFLLADGVKVARFLRTIDGARSVKTPGVQFHVQEFVDGETLPLNSAPDWFLEQSADVIGRIHSVLSDYDALETSFEPEFFSSENALRARDYYQSQLDSADGDSQLAAELAERVRHLDRVAGLDLDAVRLTYGNSHGDFWNNQIIVNNRELTVIDWTSASKLPLCLEVINSYVTESPSSKSGAIDIGGLKRYIECYSRHFSLSRYDLLAMPFVLYFQQLMCHYPPPYSAVPDSYQPICRLINAFTEWLYVNAESLSAELMKG